MKPGARPSIHLHVDRLVIDAGVLEGGMLEGGGLQGGVLQGGMLQGDDISAMLQAALSSRLHGGDARAPPAPAWIDAIATSLAARIPWRTDGEPR